MKRNQALAAVLFLCLAGISSKAEADQSTMVKQVDESVVRIVNILGNGATGTGSGFVVDRSGVVITNHHVIEGGGKLLVIKGRGDQGRPFQARVLHDDPGADIAVLRVDGLNAPAVDLHLPEPAKGLRVYAMGFPGAADNVTPGHGQAEASVSEGVVSRVVHAGWGPGAPLIPIIQHTAFINPGNSGGPLFNECGSIVGINTAVAAGRINLNGGAGVSVDVPQGIFLASHASVLAKILTSLDIKAGTQSSACTPPGGAGSVSQLWVFIALILAASALVVARRKPEIIRETYTQWIRRSNGDGSNNGEVAGSARWSLTGKDGRGRQINWPLRSRALNSQAGITIGRDPAMSQLVIDDDSVSRQHIRLRSQGNLVTVEDMKSSNGTRINGRLVNEPFKPHPVPEGATLAIGETEFILSRRK